MLIAKYVTLLFVVASLIVVVFEVIANIIQHRRLIRSNVATISRTVSKAGLKELLKRADAGDEAARMALIDQKREWMQLLSYSVDHKIMSRLGDIIEADRKATICATNRRQFISRVNAWRHAEIEAHGVPSLDSVQRTYELIRYLRNSSSFYDSALCDELMAEFGLTFEGLREKLSEQVQAAYEALIGQVATDRVAFLKCKELLGDRHLYDTGGARRCPYPDNWNVLVARYFENPMTRDFVGLKGFARGDLRLAAAKALAERNFTTAKIVLAWCNQEQNNRIEVGDVLISELAKLVVSQRAAASVVYE